MNLNDWDSFFFILKEHIPGNWRTITQQHSDAGINCSWATIHPVPSVNNIHNQYMLIPALSWSIHVCIYTQIVNPPRIVFSTKKNVSLAPLLNFFMYDTHTFTMRRPNTLKWYRLNGPEKCAVVLVDTRALALTHTHDFNCSAIRKRAQSIVDGP